MESRRWDIVLYAGSKQIMRYQNAIVDICPDYLIITTSNGTIVKTNLKYIIAERN